jgi:hypothetical protein
MAQGEWKRTTDLIERAVSILTEQWPMTIRQLFYQLVSAAVIVNCIADYRKVSRVMTIARNDGRCPWKYIVDRNRPEYAPAVWDDLTEYLETCRDGYRKDYWKAQPQHCEIWTEKDAVIGSIEATARELGVTVKVFRGFSSTTKAHEAGQSFLRMAHLGKPATVFYLGDHDPSGRDIERDILHRAQKYGVPFSIRRLAILPADIRKFNLPPLRVKETDSRAAGFLRKYKSGQCVELDALPPEELRRRIREAVEGLIEMEKWNRAVVVEKAELASIENIIGNWPGVEQGGDTEGLT